jgi:hypothetical protein
MMKEKPITAGVFSVDYMLQIPELQIAGTGV